MLARVFPPFLLLVILGWSANLPCLGQSSSAAIGGSVTVTRHANKAAEYYESGDFINARDEFRKCIAYSPNSIEFYEGLMNCCEKTKEWDQVDFALEKMVALDPKQEALHQYDLGMALYHLNRFDEAIPHLKAALATADIPPVPFKPIQVKIDESTASSSPPPLPAVAVNLPPVQVVKPKPIDEVPNTIDSHSDVDKMGKDLETYINAIRSECILIAEYEGYDKNSEIRYNSPPIAHYHIDRILKGPPLNKALPIRYEFHTTTQTTPPKGWKFDAKKMMPEKGSKWILFIEFAVPVRLAFETYQGSYGRQPATDDNLNKLDQLLESHNMKLLQ